MTRPRAGFTLIELLIALAILAVVSTLAYRAVASLTDSEAKLAAEGLYWRNLDAFFARLEADARGAVGRDVRTGARTEAAWIGSVTGAGDAELRFSRAGPEFAMESGSGGQRIGYRQSLLGGQIRRDEDAGRRRTRRIRLVGLNGRKELAKQCRLECTRATHGLQRGQSRANGDVRPRSYGEQCRLEFRVTPFRQWQGAGSCNRLHEQLAVCLWKHFRQST